MAILPIFMTSKRPMGQNGAVRFFGGTEGSMSNIAQKKNQLKIFAGIFVMHILILIYYIKQAFLGKK